MRADEAVRDSAFVEETHEKWPGHIQEVRRLLRGQLGVNRNDRHSVAVRHLPQDLQEQLVRLTRHRDGDWKSLSLWADLNRSGGLPPRQRRERTKGGLGLLGLLGGRKL